MAMFVVWIVSISLEQKTNVNIIKNYAKKKDFFKDVMPPKDNKILEVVLYQKSDKVECFIHADLEYLYWKFIHNKSKWKYSIRFFNVYNIII